MSWTSGWVVLSVRCMNETRISELRTQMGWTQERLADESGVTVRTVQRLEAGNDGSLDTLSRVATAFGVPVRDLFVAVSEDDYGRSVTALDERTTRQQERRGRVEEGFRALYYGVGVLVTIAVVVAVATDVVPNVAVFSIPGYWVAGWLLSVFLFLVVLSPRLDRAYPLSRAGTDEATSR